MFICLKKNKKIKVIKYQTSDRMAQKMTDIYIFDV